MCALRAGAASPHFSSTNRPSRTPKTPVSNGPLSSPYPSFHLSTPSALAPRKSRQFTNPKTEKRAGHPDTIVACWRDACRPPVTSADLLRSAGGSPPGTRSNRRRDSSPVSRGRPVGVGAGPSVRRGQIGTVFDPHLFWRRLRSVPVRGGGALCEDQDWS